MEGVFLEVSSLLFKIILNCRVFMVNFKIWGGIRLVRNDPNFEKKRSRALLATFCRSVNVLINCMTFLETSCIWAKMRNKSSKSMRK